MTQTEQTTATLDGEDVREHLPARKQPPSPGAAEGAPLVTVIEARSGWQIIDWREMVEYRDLLRFLIWRDIKVLYAQSSLGIGWAIVQPVVSMIVFTIIFGRLAQVSSDGVPYAIFTFTALVPWTYFANSLTQGTASLIANANMLSKVYFPRLMLPLSSVFAKLVDFGIAMVLLFVMMAWYGFVPGAGALLLPLLVLMMILCAAGLSMWLTALAIQYRDIKHAINFIVQLLMYAAPVVYPASLIPQQYRLLYAVNPMVGVIEGFRSALLGTQPMPWDLLAIGGGSSLLLALSGAMYFRRKERIFADVA